MDKVFIQGLTIQTTIGFYAWEKEIKQTLVIDAEMAWNTALAAENDELAKTLDYAAISEEIEKFANDNPVDLLETLAERTPSRSPTSPGTRRSSGATRTSPTAGTTPRRARLLGPPRP